MRSPSKTPTYISIRLGSWFEARATGWAVVAVPVSLLVVVGAGLVSRLL